MTILPDTRASLIVRLKDARDVAAWEELLDVYGPIVYRLARGRGLQATDAEDLVQEVFAAVARSVQGWLEGPDRGPFRAWLLCIARNTAVNHLTRPKHRGLTAERLEPDAIAAAAPEELERFDFEYRRELFRWAAAQVQDAVAPKTWRAFWETAVEQRDVSEVAAELGMTEGSVYIARSRVMARLRECVRRREESES